MKEPTGTYSGNAGMFGLWKNQEDYAEIGSFLILSDSNKWTDPAPFTDYGYLNQNDLINYDPDPDYSYINWRQPLEDCIKSLNTYAADPLGNHMDHNPRQDIHFQ